jgi:hypothetical protein
VDWADFSVVEHECSFLLAHAATTVLDLVKKGQQNRVRVFGSCQITA